MAERIDLAGADDPRDVVHRAVACLARGGVVGLPAGAGYALVASPLHPEPVARLRGWLAPDAGGATVLLRGAEELVDWVDLRSTAARKLPARAWPGPVAFRFPARGRGLVDRLPHAARALALDGGRITFEAPGDGPLREILRLVPGPLLQIEGNRLAGRPDLGADDLARLDGVAMVLDAGDLAPGWPPSTVALDDEGWSVVAPGAVPEQTLMEWSGTIILFVCTGNTCRSPMAEALCKAVLARRLGCQPDDLPRRGFTVLSAGVAAGDGMPAAANAVAVVRARGGSLAGHSSRPVTPELVRAADHILAMTWDHLDCLLDWAPEAADRARLLDPDGGDVPDPVGLDEATYRDTARTIERHLEALLVELGL